MKRAIQFAAITFFVACCTTVYFATDAIERERALSGELHRQLHQVETANLEIHEDLQSCFTIFDESDAAFYDLVSAHTQLQDLHRETMVWGPMQSPRDCVRETILMEWKLPIDESLWPTDRDAQLAHCIGNLEWSQRERLQLVQAMDTGLCSTSDRFALPDLGAGDVDSTWIYPPGYEPPTAEPGPN
jgi:hypothetical protein